MLTLTMSSYFIIFNSNFPLISGVFDRDGFNQGLHSSFLLWFTTNEQYTQKSNTEEKKIFFHDIICLLNCFKVSGFQSFNVSLSKLITSFLSYQYFLFGEPNVVCRKATLLCCLPCGRGFELLKSHERRKSI